MIHIDWILVVIAGWLLLGIGALLALHDTQFVARRLFPVGALLGLALAGVALAAVFEGPQVAELVIGLPGLPMHLRLDALSAFFLVVIGVGACGTSLFSAGYFRSGEGTPPGLLCLEYHVFLAAMAMVTLADDGYAFLVMWETMALASFFLVTANHRVAAVRSAAYLYLLIAHVGAIAILLCFGVLQADSGDYTFANLRAQHLGPVWSAIAFGLAVAGFGAKAGLVPLHVWLPEAHPAAPSPVSALMSAVMLKTAIYGLLRVTFDLLHGGAWWWGLVLLGLGLASALLGVVFSTVQTEMKRLLAYSSIENVGLIATGLGLALIFRAYGLGTLAALALTAALVHVLAHCLFKSLLFLGTGAVLHATGERNLGKLGGLIRSMPWVAWLVLVGVLAGSGLPPLAGFISEWLLLQSFLFTTVLPNPFLGMLIPLVAAAVALVAALACYAMVKFYGVVFLGQPREEKLLQARDAASWERLGLAWFALGAIALGLFPIPLIDVVDRVTRQLVGNGLAPAVHANGWLLLSPIGPERASYSPILFLAGVGGGTFAALLLARRLYRGALRRGPAWACGYAAVDAAHLAARTQDSAEGFGQPIRQIFEPFFRVTRHLPSPFDERPRYEVRIEDRIWHGAYLPVAALVDRLARIVALLQRGRISIYLMYSFVTLVTLLLVVRW
jgi:formate hydrogenlyase subunit 3/multisubunit Na+/H+ antiporter MnhD subunit